MLNFGVPLFGYSIVLLYTWLLEIVLDVGSMKLLQLDEIFLRMRVSMFVQSRSLCPPFPYNDGLYQETSSMRVCCKPLYLGVRSAITLGSCSVSNCVFSQDVRPVFYFQLSVLLLASFFSRLCSLFFALTQLVMIEEQCSNVCI